MGNNLAIAVEPLFASAHDALTFAFRHSAQVGAKVPCTYGMPPAGGGKGLGGLDGAAQAGMIRAEVNRVTPLKRNLIIARYVPKTLPCSCRSACCSGYRPNTEFVEAIREVSLEAYKAVLAGCLSNNRLRGLIVEKYFGRSVNLADMAENCDVNVDTASAHNSKIVKLLKREEPKAYEEIDMLLKSAGIIFT